MAGKGKEYRLRHTAPRGFQTSGRKPDVHKLPKPLTIGQFLNFFDLALNETRLRSVCQNWQSAYGVILARSLLFYNGVFTPVRCFNWRSRLFDSGRRAGLFLGGLAGLVGQHSLFGPAAAAPFLAADFLGGGAFRRDAALAEGLDLIEQ